MNRMTENTLSAVTALLIGFYAGTQWNTKGPDITPSAPNMTENSPVIRNAEVPAASVEVLAPLVTTTAAPLFKKSANNVVPAQDPRSTSEPTAVRHIAQNIVGFDSKKLDAVYQQIHSENPQQRQQALLALAQFGTEEVVSDLIRAAADDEESSELRRELIQQINWSGHTEELGDILSKSRDAEARLAAVNAIAAAENLTDAEFDGLGQTMINNFLIEHEEGVKIATLNCIQSLYPDSFQEVLEKYPRVLATPEVQNYLKMIATPPDEMEEVTAEEKAEEFIR